jgi:hypothetical protein
MGGHWPSYPHPWTGSFHMWPGPRGPPRLSSIGPAQPPHAFVTGANGQWAGPWSLPGATPPLAPLPPAASLYSNGWDQQALAAQF